MININFGGSPWAEARPGNKQYDDFVKGWNRWAAKHPDEVITEMTYPNCGPLWSAIEHVALKRLLLKMLHPNPEKRITIADVVNDRWMKGVECCTKEDFHDTVVNIDASQGKSCRKSTKNTIQKMHNHLPPQVQVSKKLLNGAVRLPEQQW
jgi:hypothetical protein